MRFIKISSFEGGGFSDIIVQTVNMKMFTSKEAKAMYSQELGSFAKAL